VRYYKVAVNLAEVHGKEAAVTTGYREAMAAYNSADAKYVIPCSSLNHY
jgi:hypothetical protein